MDPITTATDVIGFSRPAKTTVSSVTTGVKMKVPPEKT